MSLPPNIKDIRFSRSYNDTFALVLEWNIGLVSMAVLGLYIILEVIRYCCLKKKRVSRQNIMTEPNIRRRNEMDTQIQRTVQTMRQPNESYQQEENRQNIIGEEQSKTKRCCCCCLDIFLWFLFYLLCLLCVFLIVNLYMFNLMGRGGGIAAATFFIVAFIFLVPITIRKYIKNKHFFSQHKVCYIIECIVWLSLFILLVLFTQDFCFCFFNTKYGLNLVRDSSLSTGLSRTITLGTICQENEVRHLYATLPQNGSTSVYFNLHTGTNLIQLTLKLKIANTTIATKNSTSFYNLTNVQSIGHRMIHSVLFDNLTPSTTYQLEVSDKAGLILANTTYRTLPAANSSLLKIAEGGDVGMTKEGDMITNTLADFDPDVIVIGGDIAYDNAMRTCYYSWDTFYDMFETVYKKINRVIPMILSIGNHEIGFDSFSEVPLDKQPDKTPLYFLYNPQNSGKDPTTVPDHLQRDTLHYHILGPVLMFNLDSGYLHTYEQQKRIMKTIAAQYPRYYRFANYHDPIYPLCADSNKDSYYQKVIAQGLLHWVPSFDQLNFTTAMQHHTHFMKMTFKLTNDTISADGVRYIGDGSWGVPVFPCPFNNSAQRTQIMQYYTEVNPNHMWQVTLTRTNSSTLPYSINYTSIDINGNLILTKIDQLSTPPL